GSAHFLRIRQQGRRAQYIVGANPAITPVIAHGAAGTYSLTSPTLVSVSVVSFVPSTASAILVAATRNYQNGAAATVQVAPNTSYGGANNGLSGSAGMISPILIQAGAVGGQFSCAWLALEATSVAWMSSAAGGAIACMGWEDNI